ncbi:MAG TPA: DUF3147 family protein [Saprospiraceae bacterium]|nr:DUF3147 family protein [Saprospiraceae bacterium]
MTSVLLAQVLVSFFVGGSLITLLSVMAEKTNQHIAGIIMMFPTTLVLGFFFLGLTTNAENVSNVIPATLIPLGIIIFSSIIYIYCSIFYESKVKNKLPQIFCALLTSIIIWFILAAPFAIYKFSNKSMGILGFLIIITITHLILRSKHFELNLIRPKYTKKQLFIRAFFTGIIIATVVLLGKTSNPFWAGIFTMFPAATFSTLIILHFYYEPRQLFYFMKSAPLGSVSLFIYAISIMLLFPKLGIWVGTLISYVISLTFGLLLIKFKLRLIKENRI